MDLGLFGSLVDQAAAIGVREVRLFLAGEPFLHPDLATMIERCTARGLRSQVNTNATAMTPERSRAALDAGVSCLVISLDGADASTYEANRPGATFSRTVENVRALLAQRARRDAARTEVVVQTIRPVGEPLAPPPGLRALFAGLPAPGFKVIHPHNFRGESREVAAPRRDLAAPVPCKFLWHQLDVAWDGRVLGCCADLNGFLVRGDLTRETILDVWNNEATSALRASHRRPPSAHALCRDCSIPVQDPRVPSAARLALQEWVKKPAKAVLAATGLRRG
jgi:hypothetical protein